MALAYYSQAATEQFWSEHWRGESLEALIRVAETSSLTDLILRALPPTGAQVLEAGCGLGQYVLLLQQRGYRAVGTDWSCEALRACRTAAPAALLGVMDLRTLSFRSEAFTAYISLGVVEHDPDGPDAILQDAWRVLEPGGVLIISVPYVNAVRRLGSWWIRRRHDDLRRRGGRFYQFVLTRKEGQAFIERNGFRVTSATPYDPSRILRIAIRRLRRRLSRPPRSSSPSPGRAPADRHQVVAPAAARRRLGSLAKSVMHTPLALQAFGHMILFVAVKR
jgi:SAM-dependent methyltransferase